MRLALIRLTAEHCIGLWQSIMREIAAEYHEIGIPMIGDHAVDRGGQSPRRVAVEQQVTFRHEVTVGDLDKLEHR
ncbi:MAG: hypothetical protein AAF416_23070, partial [Pseudomonadota bacterium]